MAKKATKNQPQFDWPESIDLSEKLPEEHERAGQLRYRITRNGRARMDMVTYQEVPQNLVDAALKADAEAAELQQQSQAA